MNSNTGRRVSPAVLWWLAAGVLLLALDSVVGMAPQLLLLWASILGGAHALGAFWRHGEQYISAPGIVMLGLATFVYFPGVYLSFTPPDFVDTSSLTVAIFAVYFGQVLLYYLTWKPHAPDRSDLPAPVMAPGPRLWGFNVGILLIVAGYIAQEQYGLDSSSLAGAAAFLGATMIVVTVLQARARLSLPRLVLAGGAFALYSATMFTGGGRLVLGGLAMTIAVAASRGHGPRLMKLGVLVAVPVGLMVLAVGRARSVAASWGGQETGLESVIWPLERLAQLISMASEGKLEHGLGSTFYATAVLFVPRSMWPEKPIGFGAELTRLFRPEIAEIGHSEAALLHGEWVYNFGLVGVVLLLPVTAWFVNWIDRKLVASQRSAVENRRQLLARVATILAAAGLLDLVWVGTFMYMSRTGQRLLVLFALFVLFAWKARTPAPRPEQRRRPRRRFAAVT